jgi:excisionase family DNA binding protein
MKNKQWLSLSDAADMLGIHPGTLRKWSDEGKLPVHLTSGGHRRYLVEEVTEWRRLTETPQTIDLDNLLDKVLQAVRTHIQHQSLETQDWYARLDNDTRDHYRTSGRSLAHAVLFFLASSGEDIQEQARTVGYDYAARSRKHNLSNIDATRAFLYFRNLVLEAILSAYQSARATPPAAWVQMLQRFHAYTDEILLAILESYNTHSPAKNF